MTHQKFRVNIPFFDADMGDIGNDAKSTAGGSDSGQKRLCARLRCAHCPVHECTIDQNRPMTTCFVFSATRKSNRLPVTYSMLLLKREKCENKCELFCHIVCLSIYFIFVLALYCAHTPAAASFPTQSSANKSASNAARRVSDSAPH